MTVKLTLTGQGYSLLGNTHTVFNETVDVDMLAEKESCWTTDMCKAIPLMLLTLSNTFTKQNLTVTYKCDTFQRHFTVCSADYLFPLETYANDGQDEFNYKCMLAVNAFINQNKYYDAPVPVGVTNTAQKEQELWLLDTISDDIIWALYVTIKLVSDENVINLPTTLSVNSTLELRTGYLASDIINRRLGIIS